MINDRQIGTWELASFEIIRFKAPGAKGVRESWGRGIRGMLLYTEDGQMSVSISKKPDTKVRQSEAQRTLDSILFYAGSYRVLDDSDEIVHSVKIASDPARVGKKLRRFVNFDGDNCMTISAAVENNMRAVLKWRRA